MQPKILLLAGIATNRESRPFNPAILKTDYFIYLPNAYSAKIIYFALQPASGGSPEFERRISFFTFHILLF